MTAPWCELCGEPADQPVHARCTLHADLEPPRYCGQCRRRMTVQITPAGWSAKCVEHGTRTAG